MQTLARSIIGAQTLTRLHTRTGRSFTIRTERESLGSRDKDPGRPGHETGGDQARAGHPGVAEPPGTAHPGVSDRAAHGDGVQGPVLLPGRIGHQPSGHAAEPVPQRPRLARAGGAGRGPCRILPDWTLVQGDTTTAFAAALASFHRRVKVGHVEAGLRSYDRFKPYPEE